MLNTCDYLVLHAGVPCFARALAYASWFVPDVFNFASLILLNSARRNFSYSSLMWAVFILSFIAFFVADNALILFFQLLPVVLILARLTPPSSSFSVRQLEYWIVYASLWITLSLANLQDCDRIKYNIDGLSEPPRRPGTSRASVCAHIGAFCRFAKIGALYGVLKSVVLILEHTLIKSLVTRE